MSSFSPAALRWAFNNAPSSGSPAVIGYLWIPSVRAAHFSLHCVQVRLQEGGGPEWKREPPPTAIHPIGAEMDGSTATIVRHPYLPDPIRGTTRVQCRRDTGSTVEWPCQAITGVPRD
ncbi:hypothetical protein GCM10023223_29820 [Stackebrandtia albiflava]